MFELVLTVLTIESSYAQNRERAATTSPDTIQFWLTPDSQWRIRTYAMDDDIHVYSLGARPDGSRFTRQDAIDHVTKHYNEVLATTVTLRFRNPDNQAEVRRVLEEHNLSGTLEVGSDGLAFYNPSRAEYCTRTESK